MILQSVFQSLDPLLWFLGHGETDCGTVRPCLHLRPKRHPGGLEYLQVNRFRCHYDPGRQVV